MTSAEAALAREVQAFVHQVRALRSFPFAGPGLQALHLRSATAPAFAAPERVIGAIRSPPHIGSGQGPQLSRPTIAFPRSATAGGASATAGGDCSQADAAAVFFEFSVACRKPGR